MTDMIDLSKLPPRARLYAEYAQDGMSATEIANEVGVARSTVRRAAVRYGFHTAENYDPHIVKAAIADMSHADACEYLVDAIEYLFPCLSGNTHPFDEYASSLAPDPARLGSYLFDRMGKVTTREQCMSMLFFQRPENQPNDKIIDIYVCKIRKAINGSDLAIENTWGRGWKMVRKVTP